MFKKFGKQLLSPVGLGLLFCVGLLQLSFLLKAGLGHLPMHLTPYCCSALYASIYA